MTCRIEIANHKPKLLRGTGVGRAIHPERAIPIYQSQQWISARLRLRAFTEHLYFSPGADTPRGLIDAEGLRVKVLSLKIEKVV
jgi:hypothetical protein